MRMSFQIDETYEIENNLIMMINMMGFLICLMRMEVETGQESNKAADQTNSSTSNSPTLPLFFKKIWRDPTAKQMIRNVVYGTASGLVLIGLWFSIGGYLETRAKRDEEKSCTPYGVVQGAMGLGVLLLVVGGMLAHQASTKGSTVHKVIGFVEQGEKAAKVVGNAKKTVTKTVGAAKSGLNKLPGINLKDV